MARAVAWFAGALTAAAAAGALEDLGGRVDSDLLLPSDGKAYNSGRERRRYLAG